MDSPPGRTSASTAASSAGRRTADAVGPGGLQRAHVLADVALQREDADVRAWSSCQDVMISEKHPKKRCRVTLRHYQPRVERRWSTGRSSTLMPTMA